MIVFLYSNPSPIIYLTGHHDGLATLSFKMSLKVTVAVRIEGVWHGRGAVAGDLEPHGVAHLGREDGRLLRGLLGRLLRRLLARLLGGLLGRLLRGLFCRLLRGLLAGCPRGLLRAGNR